MTQAQLQAFGRHAVTFAMGVITALSATHVVSASSAHDAGDAINQISTGLASIITGATTLVAFASAAWATISASLKHQIAAVQASPEAQVTVSDPKLATGIAGVKVGPVS